MEEEDDDSTNDLHQELDILDSKTTLTDEEAEERFIAWYEEICNERMEMLQAEEDYKKKIDELETAEEGYRRRIKDLENSTIALVKTFEEAQIEIKALRDKYEASTDGDTYVEPYNVVSGERNKLLQEVNQNRKLIKTLEDEVNVLKTNVNAYDGFQGQNKDKLKYRESVGKLVVITSTERLRTFERENGMLRYKLEKIKKENQSLTSKLKVAESKVQDIESISIKKQTFVNSAKPTIIINKKGIRTFLPRIQSVSSSLVSYDQRSSFTYSSKTPALKFGLGYGEIHNNRQVKRQTSNDTSSLSSSRTDSLSKYMI